MRIEADSTKCAGNGICEGLFPERFQIQTDNKVRVLQENLEDDEAIQQGREAVEMCPAQALLIVD